MKAVVASSRLGSASSSHGSIQESQKASQEPSPTQDGSEDVKALPEGEEIHGYGAQVAVEGAEAEGMKVQVVEEVEEAEISADEATERAPEAGRGAGVALTHPGQEAPTPSPPAHAPGTSSPGSG